MMALWCNSLPQFQPNDRVVSLVYHPPEIEPGTKGVIVSPQQGSLYAVQLPNGELHRWFAGFELEPIKTVINYRKLNMPGSPARIISTEGHPPHIKIGTVVRVVQSLGMVTFYDLMLDGKGYHR